MSRRTTNTNTNTNTVTVSAIDSFKSVTSGNTMTSGYTFDTRKDTRSFLPYEIKPIEYERVEYIDTIQDVIDNNIHAAIVRHCLKMLFSKGNMTAYELLAGHNGIISIEDLQQEVLLTIIECYHSDLQTISEYTLVSDTIKEHTKEIYGTITKYMYSHSIRHYKHTYIEIDGDIVDVNKISQLATYCDIDGILDDEYIKAFMDTLTDTQRQVLMYRLQGYTIKEIADTLNRSQQAITEVERRYRKLWQSYTSDNR